MVFSARSRHSSLQQVNKRVAAGVPYQLKKTVVLVGMMGAGKTSVGTALARRIDVPFRDSDHALEEAANRTIAEIFTRDGEAFFREKESQVIERLLHSTPCILSTGGGAFLSPRNREMIAARAVAVWLKADIRLLWSRVRHKDTRPLLRTPDPFATLTQIAEQREPAYAEAGLVVEADARYSIEDMVQRVIDTLLTRPDVLERR
ncbi:shikimate kinase [Oceaniglobus roseus]|uniref:shikimate kinase n=1 Tax=Oceaniglobus roseus TaxID=1737570 RepID=UPI000C7EC0C5|nr:shikimate kinase [Kandeliimicrobium roseum]